MLLPTPHRWLRPVRLAHVPGPSTALLDGVLAGVRRAFRARGDGWVDRPDDTIDSFVTTARYGEPVSWRHAPMFTGRKRYRLSAKPTTYAFVHLRRAELADLLRRFAAALVKDPLDPADFALPGLAPNAWTVLGEQGRRGGPMMCVARLLQAQSKSLRVVMVVGDDAPVAAYLFDLAGAYPRCEATDPARFCAEIALRMATALSTREVTDHRAGPARVSREEWRRSGAAGAMLRASHELGRRRFFTRMVSIADLVEVPAITGAVAQQYSEGCFGTWDPLLRAQVVTVTGSRHPVVKGSLTEDDLAVIEAVLDDGRGVLVRPVDGLRNDPPSSEAVEFQSIDDRLPRVAPPPGLGAGTDVPVVRSKLHGHRGVVAYDPATVEFVPLDPPYYDYLVSCSTEAQAWAVNDAFARSDALRFPGDPRTVVFTVLPGHGLLMAEKWVAGTAPFDVLLAAMDEGRLEVSHGVPQGRMRYVLDGARMRLEIASGGVRPAAAGRAAEVRDTGLEQG